MFFNIHFFSNIIGILGVTLILIAYFLSQLRRWASDSLIYLLFNLIGAFLIMFSLLFHWNLASMIIEIAWATISIIGIYRLFRKKSFSKKIIDE
jgi:hypothetical protein